MAASASLSNQTVDWSGIRALAITVGVREAARRSAVNLPVDEQNRFVERVMKRCSTEKWLDAKAKAISAVSAPGRGAPKPLSANLRNGGQAALDLVNETTQRTRVTLAKVALNGAEAMYKRPGSVIATVKQSQTLRNITDAASKIGGWDADKREGDKIMINIGILGQ